MQQVTGIGGVFLKVNDPKKMAAWYEEHLGIGFGENQYVSFKWTNPQNPEAPGNTVFSFFRQNSKYFDPGKQACMINFRVTGLYALLETLKNKNVPIIGNTEEYEYGKFAWIMDPEGNKIELWEPADENRNR